MKKITIATVGAVIFSCLSSLAEEVVNIYSQRHYPADKEIFAKFTKDTGITVNVVEGSASELLERLKKEGKASPADLLITKDAAQIYFAAQDKLLQSVKSDKLNAQVPEHLREKDGKWFGLTQRARIIAYHKGRVSPTQIKTYADLADPKWQGRILARSSSNSYNQSLLASIIANEGKKNALLWAVQVRKNMARAPQGSDRDQLRALAAGVGDVAIVNTYYLGLLANSDNPKDRKVTENLGIIFPNQPESPDERGTHMNISAAGVTANAKNVANAVKLLEYLTAPDAQKFYSEKTYEYPLSLKLTTQTHINWGEFKNDDLHLNNLGKNNAEAVKIFQAAQWE